MTLNIRSSTKSGTVIHTYLTGICLLFTALAGASAETRYVSDNLEITLRSGESTQHKILSSVTSGTPLQVLKDDAQGGYTQVRTPQGVEGWVLTRYLMDHPSAEAQLADATAKLNSLKEENKSLKAKLSDVSGDKSSLSKDKNDLLTKNDKLQSELDHISKTAADAIAIEHEKNRLADESRQLQNELQTVQEENRSLKDRSNREWFVRGAGVVIAGIILGLILPKIRFRSRSSWNTLR